MSAKIGVTYENRKTGKVATCVSIDEKYGTLMFETSDGKTFTMTGATFKSNWRIKDGEASVEAEITSVETDVEQTDESKVEKPISMKEVKHEKRKKDTGDFMAMVSYVKDFMATLDHDENNVFSMNVDMRKHCIRIKKGKRNCLELFSKEHRRKDCYMLVVNDYIEEEAISKLFPLDTLESMYILYIHEDDWSMKHHYELPPSTGYEEIFGEILRNALNKKEDK